MAVTEDSYIDDVEGSSVTVTDGSPAVVAGSSLVGMTKDPTIVPDGISSIPEVDGC